MYYLFTANSAKNPDGQNRAEMNYFHGLGKAGFWTARASFRRVRVWVFGAGRTENPVRACPLKEEGGARKRRGPDHGCAALVWPARARCFWVRKDEETWSYRSSHPESVPTCLLHWCSPKRTENAVRETHLE